MSIFPFFQYPYVNRYYQRYNNKNYIHNSHDENNNTSYTSRNIINNDIKIEEKEKNTQKNKSSTYSGFGPIHFQNPFDLNSEEPVLEILGISLYLDDLIILGLLFFLYKEQVQDEMLFLILILLLLT